MNKYTQLNISRVMVLASLGLLATGITLPALAVTNELEEIVVTARKRGESLRDVPGTVNVLTEATLNRAGVERAEDFINLTPGVTMVDAAEVGDVQVSIRGINGARDAENNFAFILDGVLITNPSSFNREFSNLQQIEIFKGPQGALYGRNAAAGAIIVTTKAPGDDFEAGLKAQVGDNSTYVTSGFVSGPLVEQALYGNIEFDYRSTDGFYENTFLKKDVVDNFEAWNLNGRLVWEPSDELMLDAKVRYGEVDASAISFNAAFSLPNLAAALNAPTLFEDVNDHNFSFNPNIESTNDQETFEFSLRGQYDLGWASLEGWFLYSEVEQSFLADGTSGGSGFFYTEPSCRASTAALTGVFNLPAPQFLGGTPEASFVGPYTPTTCDGYQYQVRDQDDASVEVRLTSPGDQQLRWQTGFYYLRLEREVGVATLVDNGTAPLQSLINPRTEQLLFDRFDTTVYAVFANIAYDLGESVEFSAALRYDREERDVKSLVPTPSQQVSTYIDFDPQTDSNGDGIFVNDGGAPLNPAFITSSSIPDQEETFDQIQPKISLSWDVTSDLTLFTSWGIGFKSGGFNNQGSSATINTFINDTVDAAGFTGFAPVQIEDTFEKETSSAFEAGFKVDFLDGRVNVEGAGFFTTVDDMQFFEFFVGAFGQLRVVSNIEEVELYGLELAINAALTDSLSLYMGAAVIDSEIQEYSARPDTIGNKAPYVADYTANVSLQYEQPLFNSGTIFIGRIDLNIVGDTWFHTVQDQQRPTTVGTAFGPVLGLADYSRTRRDTYQTVNLRTGFEGETWGLHLFAKNIFDEEFLEEVISAPEFGGAFIHPGNQRSYGIEASLSF